MVLAYCESATPRTIITSFLCGSWTCCILEGPHGSLLYGSLALPALASTLVSLLLCFTRSYPNAASAPRPVPLPVYLNLLELYCARTRIPEMGRVQQLGGCVVVNPHIWRRVLQPFRQQGNGHIHRNSWLVPHV